MAFNIKSKNVKKARTFVGWGRRGCMFSEKEFNNSFLKKNTGISYSRYKSEYEIQKLKILRKAGY